MKRKMIAMMMLGCCLAICGTGLTFSYQTDRSEAHNNTFCFIGENGLEAVLSEPSWQPEKGLLVIPNTVIPKDPQVTNTSDSDLDELVALKLEFLYTSACPDKEKRGTLLSKEDMSCVAAIYEIDYNADRQGDWVRFTKEDKKDPVQRFYYRDVLKRNYPETGDTTEALFTKLSVPASVNNEQYSHIQKIGGFDIRITGQVLQHMEGEEVFGLNSAKSAYEAGMFDFEAE